MGDAQISPVHPNFITNLGNAKFNDIKEILKHVKKVVNDETGIMLETEIIIVE